MNSIPTRKHKIVNRFKPEEDQRLIQLVRELGQQNWIRVSNKMPGRTSRQCKDRYLKYLSPEANNTPWSVEEEVLLKQLVNQYGPRWTFLAYFFKGRPDTQIKNKWKTFENRLRGSNQSISKSEQETEPNTDPWIFDEFIPEFD